MWHRGKLSWTRTGENALAFFEPHGKKYTRFLGTAHGKHNALAHRRQTEKDALAHRRQQAVNAKQKKRKELRSKSKIPRARFQEDECIFSRARFHESECIFFPVRGSKKTSAFFPVRGSKKASAVTQLS